MGRDRADRGMDSVTDLSVAFLSAISFIISPSPRFSPPSVLFRDSPPLGGVRRLRMKLCALKRDYVTEPICVSVTVFVSLIRINNEFVLVSRVF